MTEGLERPRPQHGEVPYVLAVAAVVAVHTALILPGLWQTRLWEDEAYNLAVSESVARGLGYLSPGTLSGGMPQLFDVRISTGPVVLVPIAAVIALGVEPVLAGRGVMALFALLLVAAAFLAGRRIAGRWGGAAAAAALLGFDASWSISPIQGPTDILGEVPTAALTLLAVAVARRHPVSAALLLGLAVQCKSIGILSLPLVAVLVLAGIRSRTTRGRRRLGTGAAAAAAFLAPTAVFQAVQLLTLGVADYADSLRALRRFLLSGGQDGYRVGAADKLAVLADSWSLFPAAAVAAAVAVAVLWMGALARALPDERRALLLRIAGASLLIVPWLAWWLLSTANPAWARHPAPGMLVAAALAGGIAVLAGQILRRSGRDRAERPRIRQMLLVGAVAVSVAIVGVQAGVHVSRVWRGWDVSLTQQRAVAALVDEMPGEVVTGRWGGMVPIAVLAGRRPVLLEDASSPGTLVLVSTGFAGETEADTEARAAMLCVDPVVRVPPYLVCRQAPVAAEAGE